MNFSDPNLNSRIQKVFENLTKVAVAAPRVANYKLAAAIVLKSRVVSYGIASYKSSPFQKRFATNEYRIYLHAELSAIKNSLYYLDIEEIKKASLYICRVKLSENGPGFVWGLSRPCEGCQKAISEFGIKEVFYTTDNGVEIL